jgi:hypothetical protein
MDDASQPPPWTLGVAATLVTAQTLCELVAVGLRSDLVPGFRVVLMLVLSLQLLFAALVTRYSAGSVFGLFVFEGMAVIAATGSNGPILLRAALAACAVAVIGLLGASLSAFPSPVPPKP